MSGVEITATADSALSLRERVRLVAAFGGQMWLDAADLRDLIKAADAAIDAAQTALDQEAAMAAQLVATRAFLWRVLLVAGLGWFAALKMAVGA